MRKLLKERQGYKCEVLMEKTINIYCDESRHLPHDGERCMVLGALWCIAVKAHEYNAAIAELKDKHNLSPYFERKYADRIQ